MAGGETSGVGGELQKRGAHQLCGSPHSILCLPGGVHSSFIHFIGHQNGKSAWHGDCGGEGRETALSSGVFQLEKIQCKAPLGTFPGCFKGWMIMEAAVSSKSQACVWLEEVQMHPSELICQVKWYSSAFLT